LFEQREEAIGARFARTRRQSGIDGLLEEVPPGKLDMPFAPVTRPGV